MAKRLLLGLLIWLRQWRGLCFSPQEVWRSQLLRPAEIVPVFELYTVGEVFTAEVTVNIEHNVVQFVLSAVWTYVWHGNFSLSSSVEIILLLGLHILEVNTRAIWAVFHCHCIVRCAMLNTGYNGEYCIDSFEVSTRWFVWLRKPLRSKLSAFIYTLQDFSLSGISVTS